MTAIKATKEDLEIAFAPLQRSSDSFSQPNWLLSPFSSNIWRLSKSQSMFFNFDIALEDNSLLSSQKNSELLLTLKHFLIAQTNLQNTGGVLLSSDSARSRIQTAAHICEYLLMRSEDFLLAKHGLHSIPESAYYEMVRALSVEPVYDSVYQWTHRLKLYLKEKRQTFSSRAAALAVSECPFISTSVSSELMEMESCELTLSRAILWTEGYYRRGNREHGATFLVDNSRLASIFFPNGTFKSIWTRPRFSDLELGPLPNFAREYDNSPVRSLVRTNSASNNYLRALRTLPALRDRSLYIPTALTTVTQNAAFIQSLGLAQIGRYQSLEPSVVMSGLRNSIEFLLEYGDSLTDAYIKIAKCCAQSEKSFEEITANILPCLDNKLVKLGIQHWRIDDSTHAENKEKTNLEIQKAVFFSSFRKNRGLYELLEVLWGSILIATGALMARRQGELADLRINDLFDVTKTRLKFEARKRNHRDIRTALFRPAPDIVINMLSKLREFHLQLSSLGLHSADARLFAFPSVSELRLKPCTPTMLNHLLDRFCDYFETSTDQAGKRKYIRQHQLRRFFATLFFWGNSQGGMEALRWFLGQADPEQLYRYITENTPGAVLREAKIDYAISMIRDEHPDSEEILNLLSRRFGGDVIHLLDTEEVTSYLDASLKNNNLTIEPLFFRSHLGNEYIIAMTLGAP